MKKPSLEQIFKTLNLKPSDIDKWNQFRKLIILEDQSITYGTIVNIFNESIKKGLELKEIVLIIEEKSKETSKIIKEVNEIKHENFLDRLNTK